MQIRLLVHKLPFRKRLVTLFVQALNRWQLPTTSTLATRTFLKFIGNLFMPLKEWAKLAVSSVRLSRGVT